MLVKCGVAVHFWSILIRFHNPKTESPQELSSGLPESWLRYHVLFLSIGIVGIIALTTTYNATDFGLASAPWILAAMIGCAVIGHCTLRKMESPDA